jgi:hypothetical protein
MKEGNLFDLRLNISVGIGCLLLHSGLGHRAEIGAADALIVRELAGGSLADDAPRLHHVAAIGHAKGREDVLLDEKHRYSLLAKFGKNFDEFVDNDRGQPEAHLVHREQTRRRH